MSSRISLQQKELLSILPKIHIIKEIKIKNL